MLEPNSQEGCKVATLAGGRGQERKNAHIHTRSLVLMSWKPFCACPLRRRRGAVSVITDSAGGGGEPWWSCVCYCERLRRVLTT